MTVVAALGAYPVSVADRLAALLAAGAAAALALLALGLALRLPALVPWTLAALGAEYVSLPYLGGGASGLPIAAGGFVLCAELAYWALEPASAGGGKLRAATVLLAAVAGGGAAVLIASVSNESVSGGLGLEAAGIAAAVIAVAVIVALAWFRASDYRAP